MPYYEDVKFDSNPSAIASYNPATGAEVSVSTSRYAMDAKVTTGFRTRQRDSNSLEVPDYIADPYAYFLTSGSQKEYEANLSIRGIEKLTEADKGHSFNSISYKQDGTRGHHVALDYQGRRLLTASNAFMTPRIQETHRVSGPFVGNHFGPATFPVVDTLPNFAQRAIKHTAPTLAAFSLSSFLGELREGLPKLGLANLKSRASIAKQAGDGYLNVQFGWLPLLRDLANITNILINASTVLQGRPMEGVPIRRTWALPPVETTESWDLPGVASSVEMGHSIPTGSSSPWSAMSRVLPLDGTSYGSAGFPATGDGRFSKRLTRHQWFVGSYVTFLPLGVDFSRYDEKVKHLIDLRLTPDVLWQLAPWSWLVDWATHIGDSIEANKIATDKLIHIHYAYAMEELRMEVFSDFHVTSRTSGSGSSLKVYNGPSSHSMVTTTTRKRRIRANPFGFTSGGLDGLNSNQIAILTALGLSRGK